MHTCSQSLEKAEEDTFPFDSGSQTVVRGPLGVREMIVGGAQEKISNGEFSFNSDSYGSEPHTLCTQNS